MGRPITATKSEQSNGGGGAKLDRRPKESVDGAAGGRGAGVGGGAVERRRWHERGAGAGGAEACEAGAGGEGSQYKLCQGATAGCVDGEESQGIGNSITASDSTVSVPTSIIHHVQHSASTTHHGQHCAAASSKDGDEKRDAGTGCAKGQESGIPTAPSRITAAFSASNT